MREMDFVSFMEAPSQEMETTLFEKAMLGKWDEVVNICMENPMALVSSITRLQDTALHLAVSDGQEQTVRKLTQIISEQPNPEMVLGVANKRGNTPLHFAALMGNVAMCKCIAVVDCSLIALRNHEGETPLFMAVLFGKTEAFHCLVQMLTLDEVYSCSRRKNGDTILHIAISGDHFDLALQIIKLFGEVLVNAVNEEGIAPLHLLAEKSSAFPSGSRLGFLKRIIYHCIFVDEHKAVPHDYYDHQLPMQPIDQGGRPKYERNPNYPDNYRSTCINFFRLFWNFITFVLVAIGRKVGVHTDEENQRQAGNPEIFKATNEAAWYKIFKFANRMMLIVLGLGLPTIKKIYEEKQQHILSIQIMNELLKGVNMYEYYHAGTKPLHALDTQAGEVQDESNPYSSVFSGIGDFSEAENIEDVGGSSEIGRNLEGGGGQQNSRTRVVKKASLEDGKEMKAEMEKETAILIAARNGIAEMVEKILELLPVAIHDVNAENKNVVLVAVENRQPHIYQLLLRRNILIRDSVFRVVDNDGNSAFHLAAKLGAYKPWLIPGEALQMQWEMKWYEFVMDSIPSNFVPRYNKKGKSPEEVFIKTHKRLVRKGAEWLTSTSQSYSVVAALIATVAFATSTTVPGGVQETGTPTLGNKPAFHLFALSSLVALCFSVTALVMFLSILTSRHQERDFGKDLPRKLLIGLTSLFISIASVLVSFCSGHFFEVQNELRYVAYAVYAATCLPVTFFAVVQFPLYFDLIHATLTKVPRRSYKPTL
ncbi:hypothetical protein I3842_08G152900 [Carya illinoinensis]|uniref:PGG domain-containing protein n=1 Tax=Carya illinoinensis TaxID=32201 RepID=A0A922EFH5_CARIL|nr:hypothetical protein I3842_08G152900 [Carya illinoinensis]